MQILPMLAIELIRNTPELVRQAMTKRHDDTPLDQILELDRKRRELLVEVEELRAQRNQVSKQISQMKERPPELIAEMRSVGDRIKALDSELGNIEDSSNDLLLRLPNIPADEVPEGANEDGNIIVRTWGEPRTYEFEPEPHWDSGVKLGIIDFETGQKVSGSRAYVLRGKGAKLQRALIQWMLDIHVDNHGYEEVYPPYMVREQVLVGSGQLPKFADNLYHDFEEDYWMIPTAEVPITGFLSGEILPPDTLPINYVAYTACFRREKMSAGRDIRGLKRSHQFDKVELYKFVEPEQSNNALHALLQDAEAIPRALEIPYRVVQLCTGDLGFAAAESYDIEMWAPGCQEWLEVSSCSNCTDFQGRRSNVRFRREKDAKPAFVHTLNGSGLALPRVMIAILENYQQADGSVVIPPVLRPYTGFDKIEPPD